MRIKFFDYELKFSIPFLIFINCISLYSLYFGITTGEPDYSFTYIFLIYISVMLHEFGHMKMSRILGEPSNKIEIGLIGGAAMLSKEYVGIPNFLITIAGPLVNFGLIVLTSAINLYLNIELLNIFVLFNIIILLTNLVPIYPLDGGRLVRSFLEISNYSDKVILNTSLAFNVASYLVVMVFFNNFVVFCAFIISLMGILMLKSKEKINILETTST